MVDFVWACTVPYDTLWPAPAPMVVEAIDGSLHPFSLNGHAAAAEATTS